jgi:type II secretion system protein I
MMGPLANDSQRNPESRTRNSGYILLEVLIAGVILGIALLALSVAVGRCVHGLSVADGYRGASQVLDDRMNLFDTGTRFQPGSLTGTSEINGRKYEWKHDVVPTDDPKLFKEIITVRWKQADGIREEIWESYRWSDKI